MATVDFLYNGKNLTIQCNNNDSMKEIVNKFLFKSSLNINSVYFLYGGNKLLDYDITFDNLANLDDKFRNKMNILVVDKPNPSFDKSTYNNNFSNNYNKQGSPPIIFETLN